MTFPVEHRPIYVCPWADMARKHEPDNMEEMVEGVARVLARHPEDRILVHAVSYKLARALVQGLYGKVGREVISYSQGWEREGAIRKYRATERSVIIAPSLDRGVDFKDEDCRVVVVAKVPYPSLGDKQVSTRTNGPGGDTWYAVQTVRTIVQMTGRGVRSKNDWAHTYILDRQFSRNVWKRNRGLFPSWWREAVEILPPSRL